MKKFTNSPIQTFLEQKCDWPVFKLSQDGFVQAKAHELTFKELLGNADEAWHNEHSINISAAYKKLCFKARDRALALFEQQQVAVDVSELKRYFNNGYPEHDAALAQLNRLTEGRTDEDFRDENLLTKKCDRVARKLGKMQELGARRERMMEIVDGYNLSLRAPQADELLRAAVTWETAPEALHEKLSHIGRLGNRLQQFETAFSLTKRDQATDEGRDFLKKLTAFSKQHVGMDTSVNGITDRIIKNADLLADLKEDMAVLPIMQRIPAHLNEQENTELQGVRDGFSTVMSTLSTLESATRKLATEIRSEGPGDNRRR